MYQYGLKKLKMQFEFFDGRKFETQGRYIKESDSIDLEFIDLDNRGKALHLEDEHCKELEKLFYGLYSTFKDMQGNEEDSEWIFDTNKYREDHK